MAFEQEKQEALTILQGIELGEMTAEESYELLNAADPVFVYLVFKWLKKHYHRDHDNHEIVRARLKSVRNSYRSLTRKAKQGEEDPLVEWFEGSHRYDELKAEDFIDLIVEKLEG